MSMAFILIKRNIKLFFKDKGMFFTSLITPAILLVLYVTFLGNVYRDSFTSNLPNSLKLSESIIEGLVGGQLISSILAVSCVTVAFCSNFLMVQDKANGTIRDLRISPVKSATLSLSYYVATLLSTLIICFAATGICLTYVAIVGWYMSLADIFFLFLDILLLVLFGTALSSIINFFLSTQGQISAVGTIISANFSGRHNHQCGIWFHLWCIYAYFFIWRRAAKNNLIFARYLWYITYPKSYNARGACRNAKSRYSNRGY